MERRQRLLIYSIALLLILFGFFLWGMNARLESRNAAPSIVGREF